MCSSIDMEGAIDFLIGSGYLNDIIIDMMTYNIKNVIDFSIWRK